MNERYLRNIGTITAEEQKLLENKSVCVVGCGGLGGGIIEGLVRMGVGKLTVIDSDVFDTSNLNRQVLSNEDNLGHAKAVEARLQMKVINSGVQVDSIQAFVDEENVGGFIYGHDAVVDALDSISARFALEDACEEENIPLIHGAIGGWCGQVAVIMPGDRLLHEIYGGEAEEADDGEKPAETNPSFTPAVVSAMEVAETLKVLLGREETLAGKLLTIDLLNHEYEIVEI